ncbi:putative 3-deoxy-D-manno-octulosonate cytidylyltransferase [Desulfitobacterium hafniense DP7]|uniref:Putative 3-deoxy-D-manno-octulosonate cytidylyltransferase n=1 Tax=Desulfitobacterium hafniense DP7 TaxID=537010 RepID=G9XVW5_DESHA|nr:3-deoxy-manno-octulosonate cytidylyltransferase [Desulfitobacterium hafniense]EHL04228.1 putative 3-deoxy-D-manno-octulosonate cytidylyltransferase [Desulfitobacterium hafniense DP7]
MKKIIGIIPSRYQSVRFPGKPLADICGKPMIWWVYNQAKQAHMLKELYVATDDARIEQVCKDNGMNVLMTENSIQTPTDRVYHVSRFLDADVYVCINGDEPLVKPATIDLVAKTAIENPQCYVVHAVSEIHSQTEVVDYTNLKTVANESGEALYISRSPIPYPKGCLDFSYKKLVCVYAFTREALEFFHDTPKGLIEKAEECDIVRFLEHRKSVMFVDAHEESLSVDTLKDLDKVRLIMSNRIKSSNNLSNENL